MKVYKLLRAAICIVAALIAVPTFADTTSAAPEKGKVFLIKKKNADVYIYEAYDNQGNTENSLYIGSKSSTQRQYWRFIPTGTDNRYYIQNIATGNYIQTSNKQVVNGSGQAVTTGDDPVEYEVNKPSSGTQTSYYYLCSTDQLTGSKTSISNNEELGLNAGTTAGGTVVAYGVGDTHDNSYWILEEATYEYETYRTTGSININTSTGTLAAKTGTTSTFAATWTSTQTGPQITLSSDSKNNMSVSGSSSTTIQTWTGSSACPYTLSISDGWVITGYSFKMSLATSGSSITLTVGSDAKSVTSDAQTVSVTGLNTSSVTAFTQSGDNKGVNITEWTVSYGRPALAIAEGADNSTVLTKYNGKTVFARLAHNLVANKWNTFCVPFGITSTNNSNFFTYCKVKKFKEVSGNSMILEDASEIEAGQPYLVKPTASLIRLGFSEVTIDSSDPATNVGSDNFKFIGVYNPKTFSETDAKTSLILVTDSKLVNPKANTTMDGLRAYFTYPGEASGVAPRLVIDGVETDLSEVVGSEAITDGRIYNLRGMYVGNDASRLAKGIYIVNGKKVVLK